MLFGVACDAVCVVLNTVALYVNLLFRRCPLFCSSVQSLEFPHLEFSEDLYQALPVHVFFSKFCIFYSVKVSGGFL